MGMQRILKHQTVFETPWFRVRESTIESANGLERYYFHDHPGCVLIVPVLDNKLVVVQREYRVAVARYCTEISAGRIDPGETPKCAAERELREETGLSGAVISGLAPFYASTGSSNERCYPFVAKTTLNGFEKGHHKRESGLEHLLLSWRDACTAATDGTIDDGPSALAILRAARELGKTDSDPCDYPGRRRKSSA